MSMSDFPDLEFGGLRERALMAARDAEIEENLKREREREELVDAAIDLMVEILGLTREQALAVEIEWDTASWAHRVSQVAVFEIDGLRFRARLNRVRIMQASEKQFQGEDVYDYVPLLEYNPMSNSWITITSLADLGKRLD